MALADIIKDGKLTVRIREFRKDTDLQQVEQLEKSCDDAAAPPAGKTSIIFTNTEVGDPLCRVRSYPVFCMMVAETQIAPDSDDYQIVGVIRAGLKEVARPINKPNYNNIGDAHNITGRTATHSKFVMAVYLSGLRVCCLYRRLGVAQQLVIDAEAWGRKHGAEYAYLATEHENHASVNLFTHKLGYIKFRSPSILVQPIYGKPKLAHIMSSIGTSRNRNSLIHILKLRPADAAHLYRSASAGMEFFPKDIDSVLRNPLNAGTWVACYQKDISTYQAKEGMGAKEIKDPDVKSRTPWLALLKSMEEGKIPWAMLSLWRYEKLIKFEVRGASARLKRWAALTRLASRLVPWVVLPCMPNVFEKAFGVQLIYGLHVCKRRGHRTKPISIRRDNYSLLGSFKRGAHDDDDDDDDEIDDIGEHDVQALMESLCWHAHNTALQAGCKAVVAETGSYDPLKVHIPHWPSLSEHDLWCIKRLSDTSVYAEHHQLDDWCKWPPALSLFLDPRDF